MNLVDALFLPDGMAGRALFNSGGGLYRLCTKDGAVVLHVGGPLIPGDRAVRLDQSQRRREVAAGADHQGRTEELGLLVVCRGRH